MTGGQDGFVERDALTPVPLEERTHWRVPALIFGGLEFTIPVLMAGAGLADDFGLAAILGILAIALSVQWVGNALQGYMGAESGLSSTFLARQSFGVLQSRVVVGPLRAFLSMGWWAVQTAVAGNAISAMLGIDYETQRLLWGLITTSAGILFAIPSVLGYESMKWTDYFAVPLGLLLIGTGIYYAIEQEGLAGLGAWDPEGSLSLVEGVSIVIGVNVSQWVIASDYTRYSRPRVADQLKIPIGIVGVGLPLFFAGAVMSVGIGSADIVLVMRELNIPVWGFLILWFATWTSQLVNNYTMGLALANAFGASTNRGRMILTAAGAGVGIVLALSGIVDYFLDFLMTSALINTAIAGVMFADFFHRRSRDPDRTWEAWGSWKKWDGRATVALMAGMSVSYVTQFVHPIGLPPVQAVLVTILCYWVLVRRTEAVPSGGAPEERASGE